VHLRTGQPVGTLLDSLSAFWPGLQVLAGDVENAIKSHLVYWHLWQKHSCLPEGFNYVNKTVEWSGYPLRPEFVESTYHLYRATRDSFYLEVGKRILKDLTKRTKVRCGFAVLHNIFSGAVRAIALGRCDWNED
jgi:mannosidase alpha-like ER degradation enhancer 1